MLGQVDRYALRSKGKRLFTPHKWPAKPPFQQDTVHRICQDNLMLCQVSASCLHMGSYLPAQFACHRWETSTQDGCQDRHRKAHRVQPSTSQEEMREGPKPINCAPEPNIPAGTNTSIEFHSIKKACCQLVASHEPLFKLSDMPEPMHQTLSVQHILHNQVCALLPLRVHGDCLSYCLDA